MGTIAEKLSYLNDTKIAIKNAIVNKGVAVADTDTFRSYADKINSIPQGTPNEVDVILAGSYGILTEEVCTAIINGTYVIQS